MKPGLWTRCPKARLERRRLPGSEPLYTDATVLCCDCHEQNGLVRVPFDEIEPLCDSCGQPERAAVHHGYSERTTCDRAGESGTLGSFMPPHRFIRGQWVKVRAALGEDG